MPLAYVLVNEWAIPWPISIGKTFFVVCEWQKQWIESDWHTFVMSPFTQRPIAGKRLKEAKGATHKHSIHKCAHSVQSSLYTYGIKYIYGRSIEQRLIVRTQREISNFPFIDNRWNHIKWKSKWTFHLKKQRQYHSNNQNTPISSVYILLTHFSYAHYYGLSKTHVNGTFCHGIRSHTLLKYKILNDIYKMKNA